MLVNGRSILIPRTRIYFLRNWTRLNTFLISNVLIVGVQIRNLYLFCSKIRHDFIELYGFEAIRKQTRNAELVSKVMDKFVKLILILYGRTIKYLFQFESVMLLIPLTWLTWNRTIKSDQLILRGASVYLGAIIGDEFFETNHVYMLSLRWTVIINNNM